MGKDLRKSIIGGRGPDGESFRKGARYFYQHGGNERKGGKARRLLEMEQKGWYGKKKAPDFPERTKGMDGKGGEV